MQCFSLGLFQGYEGNIAGGYPNGKNIHIKTTFKFANGYEITSGGKIIGC